MGVGTGPGARPGKADISEIHIRLVDSEHPGLVGFASCVLFGAFFLNNIAIRWGSEGGLYLTYPTSRSRQEVEHFHWNPITPEASRLLEEAILGRLREMGG